MQTFELLTFCSFVYLLVAALGYFFTGLIVDLIRLFR
jgi:hypothetical protein